MDQIHFLATTKIGQLHLMRLHLSKKSPNGGASLNSCYKLATCLKIFKLFKILQHVQKNSTKYREVQNDLK